jgi:hypothetical protein
MRGTKRGLALGAALVMAAACAVAPAVADTKYRSKVTLANSVPAFHGKVKSRGGDICVEGRKVRLFMKAIGRNELLGKTRTNERGRWRIPLDPSSGVFYAKVTKGGSASLGIKCSGDTSRPVSID